eukprot:9758529-Alexandrium_andersonii.AAC.1
MVILPLLIGPQGRVDVGDAVLALKQASSAAPTPSFRPRVQELRAERSACFWSTNALRQR